MRFTVLSDIHGNHIALETVLREVDRRGTDGIIYLGDYVTDFPGGREVVDMVRHYGEKYPCVFIRGNREDYLLAQRAETVKPWVPNTTASGTLYHAYRSMTDEDLDFFASMPISDTFSLLGAPKITACHASPAASRDELFYDRSRAKEFLTSIEGKIMLCGHHHLVRNDSAFGKTVYFIGSVGLAYGFGGCAQYAEITVNGQNLRLENKVLPYDVRSATEEFATRGLLECGGYWARMLRVSAFTGLSVAPAFADRGFSILRETGGDPNSEVVWQRVFREFRMDELEKQIFPEA